MSSCTLHHWLLFVSVCCHAAPLIVARGAGKDGRGEEEDEGAVQGKDEDRQRDRDREGERDIDKVEESNSSGMAVLKKISTIASSFMQVAHYSAFHLRHPVICLVDALFLLLPLSFIHQDILASYAPPISLLRSLLITVIAPNSSNVCAIFRLISCMLGAGRGWAGPSIGWTRAVPLSSLLGASSPLPP